MDKKVKHANVMPPVKSTKNKKVIFGSSLLFLNLREDCHSESTKAHIIRMLIHPFNSLLWR